MRLAYAKPHVRKSPDGPDSCEITRAITLVSSHDWHVQPFCQRPDSTPPERRFSGTPGLPRKETLELLETCLIWFTRSLPSPAFSRTPELPLLSQRTPETNLSNLPRAAAFCQCGYLGYPGANLFC